MNNEIQLLRNTEIGQVVTLSNGIKAEVTGFIGNYKNTVTVKYLRKGSTGIHGLSGDWELR
jgi:hypothetical protein